MNTKVKRKKKEEITEEQQWYRIKMARYYEEEFDKLFKTKSKQVQKIILHEPDNRVSKQFAKDLIKNAESRDWDDDNPKQY
tara:strand:+ start:28 stop:270 length:243 start_codon:yes stop_codon:yes gene_type:complete